MKGGKSRVTTNTAEVSALLGRLGRLRFREKGDECGNGCGRFLLYVSSIETGFCASCRNEPGGTYEDPPEWRHSQTSGVQP